FDAQPPVAPRRGGDEGAAAALRRDEPVAGEAVDRLAHGDARDLEFGDELLERRQLLAFAPDAAGDALTKQIGELHVERQVGAREDHAAALSPGCAAASLLASSRTSAAPFSPIMIAAALVLVETTRGITDASMTRSRSTPRTRKRASTTERASPPMRQVPAGWNTVPPLARANASSAVGVVTPLPGRYSSPVTRPRNAGCA